MTPVINWDTKTIRHETDTMVMTIRTGSSRMLDNYITARRMRNAAAGIALHQRIMHLLKELSQRVDAGRLLPNIPNFEVIDPYPGVSDRRIVVMFGIVTNGSKQRRIIGEYRFVVCMDEEVEKVLDTVFDLERTIPLLQDTPPMTPVAKKVKTRR